MWDGEACVGDPIRTFTSAGVESEQARISTDDDGSQHYIVNWQTGDDELDSEAIYRISVKAGPVELGYADVDVVQKMREAAAIVPEEYAALASGRTLAVKFAALSGAAGYEIFRVDESAFSLVSTEAELGAGVYRFEQLDGQSVPAAGQAIVGDQSGGFIRLVDDVATAGSEVTIETSFLSVADVVRSGAFSPRSCFRCYCPRTAPIVGPSGHISSPGL